MDSHDHLQKTRYQAGIGDWRAFDAIDLSLDRIRSAADFWRLALEGIARPWLCWNIDSEWCFVQQQLVESAGWTPVVGFDPRVGPPEAVSARAVVIDFNESFGLPNLFFHFPLEFAFLFCERLAFWHSDLLIRPKKMADLARRFENLRNGDMAATGAWYSRESILKPHRRRFWELVGCTTAAASRDQFDRGCGWWMNFHAHPNCPNDRERRRRKKLYWDHGTGIRYWARRYRQPIRLIREHYVAEGHCSQIKNQAYERVSPNNERRNLSEDIRQNYELTAVCDQLGIVL